MLKASAELSLETLEFACGNWSPAPHINLNAMLESESVRREFVAKVRDHGLSIAALNCSGNPLHPGPQGAEHHRVTLGTIKLASLMGIDRVVMMSGLPGGPGDANPNWIITDWPPECVDDPALPVGRKAHSLLARAGRLCQQSRHPQAVPGTARRTGRLQSHTLLRLREAVGETVGANYDPSHPMWMNADPLAAVRALGEAIYYVHAKDTRVEPVPAGIDGTLEARAGRPHRRAELELHHARLRPRRDLVAPVLHRL